MMSSECGTSVDHSVLLVGLNLEEKYWLVQNWWGEDWGEDGFIKLEIGNTCGICLRGSSGALNKNKISKK